MSSLYLKRNDPLSAKWRLTAHQVRTAGQVSKKSLSCLLLFFLFSFLILTTVPASGKVLITLDEALKLAFPTCTIKRHTIYLSKEQMEQARKLAGVEISSALVYPYVAMKDGEMMGVAYFDAHTVRTLPETIMMTVDPEDRIQRIEVLDFNEPLDYMPRTTWYQQFAGQRLDNDLAVKRNIRSIAGATLTARHTTDAVRRMMALHHVIKRQLIHE